MMEILLRLMNQLGVHVGKFVALQPSSCQINEFDMGEPVVAVSDTASHVQDAIDAQEQEKGSLSEYGIPIDFSDITDLGWPDLDFDKLMNSFIFDPFPAQQDTSGLVSQKELFGLDFGT